MHGTNKISGGTEQRQKSVGTQRPPDEIQVNAPGSLRRKWRAESTSTLRDPYHSWLAIPPEEQPPNHYRLLGIPQFTDDPYVIEEAAHQRFVCLRSMQKDEHALLSNRILNEIVAAEACLLNPETRAAYDAELRYQLSVSQPPAEVYVSPCSAPDQQTGPTPPPEVYVSPCSAPDQPTRQTPPPTAPPIERATSQNKTPANVNHFENHQVFLYKVVVRLAELLVLAAIGLFLWQDSLSPAVKVIVYHFLPPIVLTGIFVSLLLYLGLLLPVSRRWIAQRGQWGTMLIGRADSTAFEAETWTNSVDDFADQSEINKPTTRLSKIIRFSRQLVAFRQVAQQTPVAFAILSAVLVFVLIELLIVTGT